MPLVNLTDTATWVNVVRSIGDTDPASETNFKAGMQDIANRTAYLKFQGDLLSALNSVNTQWRRMKVGFGATVGGYPQTISSTTPTDMVGFSTSFPTSATYTPAAGDLIVCWAKIGLALASGGVENKTTGRLVVQSSSTAQTVMPGGISVVSMSSTLVHNWYYQMTLFGIYTMPVAEDFSLKAQLYNEFAPSPGVLVDDSWAAFCGVIRPGA